MAAPLLASFALVAIGLLFGVLMSARRIHAQRLEREELAARHRAEPVLHALLDGDAVDRDASADDAALAAMLAELSPSLAGETRTAIAEYFESTGAISRATRGVGHPLAHRRAESAAVLGDMCSGQAEPVLLMALNDRDADVRLAATRSLGRLRSRAAVIPILHSLACRHVPRAVAANAVLTIGVAALPGIRTLVTTEHPATRAAAVEMSAGSGTPATASRSATASRTRRRSCGSGRARPSRTSAPGTRPGSRGSARGRRARRAGRSGCGARDRRRAEQRRPTARDRASRLRRGGRDRSGDACGDRARPRFSGGRGGRRASEAASRGDRVPAGLV